MEEIKAKGLALTESDKILICVLMMSKVDQTFECNVHQFVQAISKIKATSSDLEFQMFARILEKRKLEIEDLLRDFMTTEELI